MQNNHEWRTGARRSRGGRMGEGAGGRLAARAADPPRARARRGATGATAAGQTLRMSPRTPESRRPRPLARPGELTTAIDNDVIIQ